VSSTGSNEHRDLIPFTLAQALLRNELPGLAAALGGGPMTPGQQAVLEGHLRLVTEHLVRQHEGENAFRWPGLNSRAAHAATLPEGLRTEHAAMSALVERVRNRALPRPERAAVMADLIEWVLAHNEQEERSVVPVPAVHITAEEQQTEAARSRAKIPLVEELRVLAMMQAAADPAEEARMLATLPEPTQQLLSDREAPALGRVHQVLSDVAARTVVRAPWASRR
jgi:hypothetical protein